MNRWIQGLASTSLCLSLIGLLGACARTDNAFTNGGPSDDREGRHFISGIKTGPQLYAMMTTALEVEPSTALQAIYALVEPSLARSSRDLPTPAMTMAATKLAAAVCGAAADGKKGPFAGYNNTQLRPQDVAAIADVAAQVRGNPLSADQMSVLTQTATDVKAKSASSNSEAVKIRQALEAVCIVGLASGGVLAI